MAGDGGSSASSQDRRIEALRQLDKIERLASVLLVGLIACAVLYSIGIALAKGSGFEFLRLGFLLIALIVTGAAIGGLLGFLFGVPKLGAATPTESAAANGGADSQSRGFFRGNTNLEEISDWLTKIIVGVGLVEAKDIYNGLGSLAESFEASALPTMQGGLPLGGQVAFLVFGLGSAVVGFLVVNLETRTRITLLLEDTESLRQGPSQADLDEANSAPITQVDLDKVPEQAAATMENVTGDDALLKMDFKDLQTGEQFAAWGSAQARAGNLQVAARALNEAITREPSNVDYLLKLAEIRQAQGDGPGALHLLEEVLAKSQPPEPKLLKRVLLNALYLNPPDGFQKAIEILQQLEQVPGAADDPSVQVWAAAAYGQQYRWLKQNQGTDPELKIAREKALAAAKRAVELSPAYDSAPRVFLRRIFDPATENTPANENDLEAFKDDEEFEAIVYFGKPPG